MTLPEQPPKETLLRLKKPEFDEEFSIPVMYGRAAQFILTAGLIRKNKGYQDYQANLKRHFYEEPVPTTGFHKITTLFHYSDKEVKQERGLEYRNRTFAKHIAAGLLGLTALLSNDSVDMHLEASWPPIVITGLPFMDAPAHLDTPQSGFDTSN
jgi:hypothetical protein